MRRSLVFTAIAVLAGLPLSATGARADDTIRRPGDHPSYDVELEPHGTFGWGGIYGTDGGFGLGFRASIPIVRNGFVPTINNSVAISFGLDWVHYSGCFNGIVSCSADYLDFPVVMQWNFYVSRHWSVFGEPGLYIYHGIFSNCFLVDGARCPNEPSQTGVLPAIYLGARYHFSDMVSITMRVGYPTLSVGVSFFP